MLEVEDVRFAHPGMQSDYRFDLTAQAGEVVAIMGASGSGKSTLLDLLAGFLKPHGGRMAWDGVAFENRPPEGRPCTILFQKDNVFGHLTAHENVALGLPKTALDRGRIAEALEQVGMGGKGGQKAQILSGGQQQRVALARSLVRQQPLLLLDEPFTGLDDESRHRMLPLVKAMADEHGRCVLMITHDREDAQMIADTLLVVENQRLVGQPL
ncbi:MAG: ATP-binding cassette domain-containing protein [Pseudomonadota bacterium]